MYKEVKEEEWKRMRKNNKLDVIGYSDKIQRAKIVPKYAIVTQPNTR